MNFSCIIMNPPFTGNLHLQILQEALKHADNVVNLSPVRWLQDPLAEYKQNSDIYKFSSDKEVLRKVPVLDKVTGEQKKNCEGQLLWEEKPTKLPGILPRIESLEVVSKYSAYNLFNVQFTTDLGVYKVNAQPIRNNYMFSLDNPYQSIVDKVVAKMESSLASKVDKDISDGIRVRVFPMKPENVHRAHNKKALINTRLCCVAYIDDFKVYKDGYNVRNGLHWGSDRVRGAGGQKIDESCPLNYSIKFDTVEEAKNFLKSTWTTFMLFYNSVIKMDNNVQLAFLPFMGNVVNPRTGKRGYEGEWTDADFYKFFNLTPEEIKIVEETMKDYE